MRDDAPPLRILALAIYSVVVAILWIPALLIRKLGRFYSELGTEGWRRANGRIASVDVRVIHGWVVDYAVGRMAFSYRVSGDYFSGSISCQFADEQAAWDYVDARRNRDVVIRYKDDHAEIGVLRDDDQYRSWATDGRVTLFAEIWQHWHDEVSADPVPADSPTDANEPLDDAELDDSPDDDLEAHDAAHDETIGRHGVA